VGQAFRVSPIGEFMSPGARQRKFTIGTVDKMTLAQARQRAFDIMQEVKQGKDPATEKQEARRVESMNALWERYLAKYAEKHKRPSTVATDRRLWTITSEFIGSKAITSVTVADVGKIKRALQDRPVRFNRIRALLSHMIAWAQHPEQGIIPAGSLNPARFVRKNPEVPKERFLNAAELALLGGAIVALEAEGKILPSAANALRLLIMTGARRNEIVRLKWSQVQDNAIVLRPGEHKASKKSKAISLPPQAYAVVAKQRGLHPEWVFPGETGKAPCSLHSCWPRLVKRAGIEHCRPHDLRHSYVSAAIALGLNLSVVQELVGHGTYQTTERYRHLTEVFKNDAAGVVTAHLDRAMRGEVAEIVTIPEKKAAGA
jgi:integrase